jgi:hypothetical protein
MTRNFLTLTRSVRAVGAEGVADKAIFGFSCRCFVHGDDVEAVWGALKVVTRDIGLGGADDAGSFSEADGGFGGVRGSSGFHFDKNEDVVVPGDEVDFAFLHAEVGGDNAVALRAEIAGGADFGAAPEREETEPE